MMEGKQQYLLLWTTGKAEIISYLSKDRLLVSFHLEQVILTVKLSAELDTTSTGPKKKQSPSLLNLVCLNLSSYRKLSSFRI